MYTVSKTHKMAVVFIKSKKKIGLRLEIKSLRLGLRAFYCSKSIENENRTFKSLKTDSKILKYH